MYFHSILYLLLEFKIFFISLFSSYVIYRLFRFYQKVWSLPPGPFPLPIIGNVLLFLGKDNWDIIYEKYEKIYGPVLTVWLGSAPIVIISDLDIVRDAFSKIEFSGRYKNYFFNHLSNEKHKDIICSSGETWEVLRKATHKAIRKYATNEKLCLLTSDCVENTINEIISKEGVEQEFSSYEYINRLMCKIMTKSIFGENYDDINIINTVFKFMDLVLRGKVKERMVLWAFSPIFRIMEFREVRHLEKSFEEFIMFLKKHFEYHYKDYDESIERDFCDALITAKKEALREGQQSLKHLTDENLTTVVFDLFIAGIGTTLDTLQWIILFMTYYPEFQQNLRQEIENQIGNRIPTHEDKNRCHFIMAFISETMRIRNVLPISVPHEATVDCKIGNYLIPKGTGIFVSQDKILTDEKHWPNAHEFRPQRFLENGEYMSLLPKAFIPFGIGRRVCVGNKLAINDIFLVFVRILQLTNEYDIVLGSNCGLEPEQYFHVERPSAEYKIILKKRSIT